MCILLDSRIWGSTGLLFCGVGAAILYKWQPPTYLSGTLHDGSPLRLPTGESVDKWRSRWGFGLIVAGSSLQLAAEWLPRREG